MEINENGREKSEHFMKRSKQIQEEWLTDIFPSYIGMLGRCHYHQHHLFRVILCQFSVSSLSLIYRNDQREKNDARRLMLSFYGHQT